MISNLFDFHSFDIKLSPTKLFPSLYFVKKKKDLLTTSERIKVIDIRIGIFAVMKNFI